MKKLAKDNLFVSTKNRYPIASRIEYSENVGALRVNNLTKAIQSFGFKTKSAKVQNNDVDIWVYDKNRSLILVSEVTNWQITNSFDRIRINSITKNLNKYPCEKLIVVSFNQNIQKHKTFLNPRWHIMEIGFMTQPPDYYQVFRENWTDKSKCMKPDSKEVHKHLRAKIETLFKEIKLI